LLFQEPEVANADHVQVLLFRIFLSWNKLYYNVLFLSYQSDESDEEDLVKFSWGINNLMKTRVFDKKWSQEIP
jgi:hypothetical protein